MAGCFILKIMRMNRRYIIWIGLIFIWAFPVHGDISAEGRKCWLPAQDFKEVSDCIKLSKNGQLFIASRYLRQLSFEKNGLAVVYSEKEGWMYVNRKGRVIISGVAAMDNGADVFHDGLVRFSQNKKWGFADEKGKVIIPAIYDCAFNFENGLAKVNQGCEIKCVDQECEHFYFSGGEWFYINTKGEIFKKAMSKEGSYE
jgi:hypothetical protein